MLILPTNTLTLIYSNKLEQGQKFGHVLALQLETQKKRQVAYHKEFLSAHWMHIRHPIRGDNQQTTINISSR